MRGDPDDLRARAAEIEKERAERARRERERELEKQREQAERFDRARRAVRDLDDRGLELVAEKPQSSSETPGRLGTNAVYYLGDVGAHTHTEILQEAARREQQRRDQDRARTDGGTTSRATVAANVSDGLIAFLVVAALVLADGTGR